MKLDKGRTLVGSNTVDLVKIGDVFVVKLMGRDGTIISYVSPEYYAHIKGWTLDEVFKFFDSDEEHGDG